MAKETAPAALFRHPPVIRFAPTTDTCSCNQKLVVQKTRHKTVLSMAGPFIAHETLFQCPTCRAVFDADPLRRMVPPRCNMGYDVMVFVGQSLFQRYRTAAEIQAELADRHIVISASEVYYLGRKFIMLLAEAHRRATPVIRSAMAFSGGYVLHIDAMHEGDAPALLTGMDSVSEIVLSNVKVPSENMEDTSRFLQHIKYQYGLPIACVHDMGIAICRAVADVFPGVRDYICHFHFLRDIGKDFLEPAYQVLRKCLQQHATSKQLHAIVREARKDLDQQTEASALLVNAIKEKRLPDSTSLPPAVIYMTALWIIRGKQTGGGYGFPFDRPLLEFAERLLIVDRQMPNLRSLGDPEKNHPLFPKMATLFSSIKNDRRFNLAVDELRWRSLIFDRLRGAMRIALPDGHNGLNDDGSPEAMISIRQGVSDFRRYIHKSPQLSADPLTIKMLAQIDKYDDKLFADPIDIDTPAGNVTIFPQRTNNILERFFRSLRRGYRRKTGNNAMRRSLQAMLADTPLVKNLDNPNYMKMLLNKNTSLEELFAEIDGIAAVSIEKSDDNSDRILPGYRSLINLPDLPERLINSLLKPPAMA